MLKFLISRVFWLNVLLAIILLLLLGYITHKMLASHTRHGESLEVPDLTGLSLYEAEQILNNRKLRFVVADSMFYEQMPKMSVLEQNPAAKAKVKEGRIIYLTINTSTPPKVKMPDITDKSFRQAVSMIESSGLRVGKVVYKPYFLKGVVLDWSYKGASVQPETVLDKGSLIDLEVSEGLDGENSSPVEVPDLIGLTYEEALKVIKDNALVPAAPRYQNNMDSAVAVIYRQEPKPGSTVSEGEIIDIFLRKE